MQPDHQQTLSALASAVFNIERQLQSLSNASNVAINGGTHNTAGRDINNNFNYHTYQISLPASRSLQASRYQQLSAGAYLTIGRTTKADPLQDRLELIPIPYEALLSGYLPVKFEGLVRTLQLLNQQVQPQAEGILGDVHYILSILSDLVVMSSNIYDALADSELGDRVRIAIDARITQCTCTLSRAHQQLDGLVYRRLPMLGLVYHYLLRSSWDRWEPGEIACLRKQLSVEAQYFAEWLSSLRSFCWARHLLLRPQSQFAWDTLNAFFRTRRGLMKDIHIERITVIEPLQGEHLTIPLRFISSFEDVHMVISLACQGTTSGRYIEAHRYELDDADTNEAVGEDLFQVSVEDGKVFEVAILIKSQSADFIGCPKCGKDQDGHDAKGGWARCSSAMYRKATLPV
ncbi:hypothetical protein BKA70DRAFT_832313 [Coprinopsis sp. MPI-PUGE-AT-0042]|nr:hypothetical protein BKA70DRAFT_832313 [Coprinopsis sp. MPI-PUGE-AT-0042]